MTCQCPPQPGYPFWCRLRGKRVANAKQHAKCIGPVVKPEPIPGTRRNRFYNLGVCGRRGKPLGWRIENLCGGRKRRFEVFTCSKHGECSNSKRDPNVTACDTCRDHTWRTTTKDTKSTKKKRT